MQFSKNFGYFLCAGKYYVGNEKRIGRKIMRRILTLTLALVLAAALLTGCTGRRNDDNTASDDPVISDAPNNGPMNGMENNNGSVSTDPDGSIGDTEHSNNAGNGTEHSGSTDNNGEPTETGEVSRGRSMRSR